MLDFVIVGAQKSASSFLHLCLAEHPEIQSPKSEMPLFENDLPNDEYEKQLSRHLVAGFGIFGIKRPNYLGTPGVAGKIFSFAPKARIVCVLRDPIHRAMSSYFHYIRDGFIPVIDCNHGFSLILDNATFCRAFPRAKEIILFSMYAAGLREYFLRFSRENILILFHEDISADPRRAVKETYSFLGVDQTYVPDALNSRPQRVVYDLQALSIIAGSNDFRYHYNEDRTRLRPRKMPPEEERLVRRMHQLAVDVEGSAPRKPALGPEIRARLLDHFREDIEMLEGLLHKDLSHWKT